MDGVGVVNTNKRDVNYRNSDAPRRCCIFLVHAACFWKMKDTGVSHSLS